LLDRIILIISSFLINNIVKDNRSTVLYSNIVWYFCAKDSKIKEQKKIAKIKAKKAIK